MLTIKLRDIQGVHPEFSRIERDLDLAPVGVPDEALIPKAMAVRINMLYPLVVSRPDALCIGQTTLYRSFNPPARWQSTVHGKGGLTRDFQAACAAAAQLWATGLLIFFLQTAYRRQGLGSVRVSDRLGERPQPPLPHPSKGFGR